jgi:hypothetical protein
MIALDQIRAADFSVGQTLIVVSINGKLMLQPANLGTGLALDLSGATPVLKVVFPPVPTDQRVWNEVLTLSTAPNPMATLGHNPVMGTVTVYRNGVRLKPGLDYQVAGATLTFAYQGLVSDLWAADYSY